MNVGIDRDAFNDSTQMPLIKKRDSITRQVYMEI